MGQHYVPEFLLRHFATGRKHAQIHVFDKSRGTGFRTSVNNVACENGFYDLDDEPARPSLEPLLDRLDGKASALISRVTKERRLGFMSAADRSLLALFSAAQLLRVRGQREMIVSVGQQLRQMFARDGDDVSKLSNGWFPDAEDAKHITINLVANSAHELGRILESKTMLLVETHDADPFYTSDAPVTLDNTTNRGHLGLAEQGIEVHLPLSPTLTISFWCPSIETQLRETHRRSLELKWLTGIASPAQSFADALFHALETGTPVFTIPPVVERLNSLQVKFSSRYVFCSGWHFDLAREMTRKHPKFRGPPKPQVGHPSLADFGPPGAQPGSTSRDALA